MCTTPGLQFLKYQACILKLKLLFCKKSVQSNLGNPILFYKHKSISQKETILVRILRVRLVITLFKWKSLLFLFIILEFNSLNLLIILIVSPGSHLRGIIFIFCFFVREAIIFIASLCFSIRVNGRLDSKVLIN